MVMDNPKIADVDLVAIAIAFCSLTDIYATILSPTPTLNPLLNGTLCQIVQSPQRLCIESQIVKRPY